MNDPTAFDYIGWFFEGMWQGFSFWKFIGIMIIAYIIGSLFKGGNKK